MRGAHVETTKHNVRKIPVQNSKTRTTTGQQQAKTGSLSDELVAVSAATQIDDVVFAITVDVENAYGLTVPPPVAGKVPSSWIVVLCDLDALRRDVPVPEPAVVVAATHVEAVLESVGAP